MLKSLYILKVFYIIFWLQLTRVSCLFEMCNHKLEMRAEEKVYLNSPYYPAEYPIGTSCRYVIKAPQDYKLKFSCNIKLNTPQAATSCQNEIFYFNREGSEILTDSEYFCGTGKMNRKSFLNQAVVSYISLPFYERVQTNVIRNSEENTQKNKTHKNETEMQKQQKKIIRTTTMATTSKALKVNQLTATKTETNTTTFTRKAAVVKFNNLLTTSFTQPFSSTTSLPTFSNIKENMKVKTSGMHDTKKVSNSFTYMMTLLSNKIDKEAFAANAPTTSTHDTTKSPTKTTIKSIPSRPKSVLKFYDILPANMWRNGSIVAHKVSTKRVAKVIVGQDYTSSPLATTVLSKPTRRIKRNARVTAGGGSFSCLVEVIEPQCECGWSFTEKIAGASGVAGVTEFPSMAGIMLIKNQKVFCGATIIHHRYLLSAAHCYVTPETNTAENLKAVVGEQDLSTVLDSVYTRPYDIIKIIRHEQFRVTASKVEHDIALLKTRLPIEWNRSVAPACLPFHTQNNCQAAVPFAGQRLETAGWGTTSFGGQQTMLLLKTTLDVISRTKCVNLLKTLASEVFCTYTPGRDTCQYDSGGALYARGERLYAVGIVSYGYACATKQPSVNTRISSYLKWIRNKTTEVKYCAK